MAHPFPLSVTRRRSLQLAAAAWAGLVLPQQARTDTPAIAGARIAADFDPVAAMWLGYDAGHEAFTADLAEALWHVVPLKMLVRDLAAENQARALLSRRGLPPDRVQFFHDTAASYFLRDAAVFGLDGEDTPFVVDFQWSSYGWGPWCRRRFRDDDTKAAECTGTHDLEAATLDRRLAATLGLATYSSPLAIEGGGVEVNGQGLLIANASLWHNRNPGMSRKAIESQMLRLPGVRKVIWLPRGLAHDPLHRGTITGPYVGWGTGGHTDEFVRFADAKTVLLAWVGDADARSHPVARLNQARMQVNFDILSASTDQDGQALRVIKVPLPSTIERPVVLSADADTRFSHEWTAASFPPREGRREGDTVKQVAISSYLNFIVVDTLVLLPDYLPHGTPAHRQRKVQELFESVFPGRRVAFIDVADLNWFGGGAHCTTLAEPAGAG